MEPTEITVKGASEHNLRDVSLTLPRGKLICFTGVSGSGKSSFAFDTLFAEGQRRYMSSLSSYARQFLGQLAKPDVQQITGLSPSISIQQKTSGWNPRSTVGTITQIHDYLRVLFARVGTQHCPSCGRAISAQTREQIVTRIWGLGDNTKVILLAPVVRGQKGEYRDLFEDMLQQGYARARVDGEIVSLSAVPKLARHIRHDIEIVVDRLTLGGGVRPRLAEAVERALDLGDGAMVVQLVEDDEPTKGASRRPASRRTGEPARARDILCSAHYACADCAISFEPPSPQLFSFNAPTGMCMRCDGLGVSFEFDPKLLVPDPRKRFLKNAIEPMRSRIGRWRRHIFRGVAEHVGFDLDKPWKDLPTKAKRALLYGLGERPIKFTWRSRGGAWVHHEQFEGVIAHLEANYRRTHSPMVRAYYEKYMHRGTCLECGGARLNPQALAVRLGGKNIHEVSAMPIGEAGDFFDNLELNAMQAMIARDAIHEIRGRLRFLQDVGLDYLALSRTAPTLAGGESQRIRLASQIGAGLVGVLYILDEPSIGLHARDNDRLLDSLKRLRDLGNTVIVVEHDEQTMRAADMIVDFGPGPGVHGGEVVAQGTITAIKRAKRSITGRYLRGAEEIEVPRKRRPVKKRSRSRVEKRSAGAGKTLRV